MYNLCIYVCMYLCTSVYDVCKHVIKYLQSVCTYVQIICSLDESKHILMNDQYDLFTLQNTYHSG